MADNPNYPIATATINWIDSNGGSHIRVYSTDGYNVSEYCWDQGGTAWTTGNFSAPGRAVSATCWMGNEGLYIRVYCTFEDVTQEWCANPGGSWEKGATLPPS